MTEWFSRVVKAHAGKILIVLGIGIIAASLGIPRLRISDATLDRDLPRSDPILQDTESIEQVLGRKEVFLILVERQDSIFREETLLRIQHLHAYLLTILPEEDVESLALIVRDIPHDPEGLKILEDQLLADPNIAGRIVAKDGKSALVVARVNNENAQAALSEIEAYVKAIPADPDESILISGRVAMRRDIQEGTREDLEFLLPATFLVMLVTFFIAFRRSIVRTLAAMTLLAGMILASMGVIGWMGKPITNLTMLTPLILIIFGGPYIIYLFLCWQDALRERTARDAFGYAVSKVLKPVLLAGLASAVGFATLWFFPIQAIREFGIQTALGTLLAMTIAIFGGTAVLVLLPRFSVQQGTRETRIERALERVLASGGEWCARNPFLVLVPLAGMLVFSAFGITKMRIETDLIEFFPRDHSIRHVDHVLNEEYSGLGALTVLVNGGSSSAFNDPSAKQVLGLFLDQLAQSEDIARVDARWPGRLEPFDPDRRYARILVFFPSIETGEIKGKVQAIQALGRSALPGMEIAVGGDLAVVAAQNDYMVRGKINNIIATAVTAVLLMIVGLWSVRLGIAAVLPFFLATIFTLGMMGWVGIPLNFATAMITGIAVGIGLDFGIHYVTFARNVRAARPADFRLVSKETGKPIFFDSLATLIGFSIFLFSAFPPVQHLGLLIVMMMGMAAVSTLLLLPALLMFLSKDAYAK